MMYGGTATMFLTGPIYYVVAKRCAPPAAWAARLIGWRADALRIIASL